MPHLNTFWQEGYSQSNLCVLAFLLVLQVSWPGSGGNERFYFDNETVSKQKIMIIKSDCEQIRFLTHLLWLTLPVAFVLLLSVVIRCV